MSAAPLISVVMPVYNGRQYLSEAVESILDQTFRDFEFVIIDDGSTDGSLDVLQTYAQRDRRIRIISRPNTGLVGALNDGLAEAKGTLIVRMDADDISLPERLARQVHYMECNPDCVAAGSSHYIITSRGETIGEMMAETAADRISLMLLEGLSVLAHPATIIRADALRRVGGYRAEFVHAEDYDLWLRLDEIGELGNLPETLFKYRWHFESICQKQTATQCRHVIKARTEAHRRRGMIDGIENTAALSKIASRRSRPDFLRLCSTVALKYGAYRPALRFILTAIALQPLNRDNWRLFLRYMVGNRIADSMKRHLGGQWPAVASDDRPALQLCDE